MFGLFSSVIGDGTADKMYHDFKWAQKHIGGVWDRKVNTEERLREK